MMVRLPISVIPPKITLKLATRGIGQEGSDQYPG
jgi:hypothetical protein